MGEADVDAVVVDDIVEYCRTQAGLLSGTVETLGETVDELLNEIDAEIAEIRSRLDDQSAVTEPSSPSATVGPGGNEVDIEAIEALEASLEEKQSLVESKQARMQTVQKLAAGYTDLAETLKREFDDEEEAIKRVVRFEAANDAPTYFTDRRTLIETVQDSDDQ
jgi:hypothetical protein